ncbi:MAG: hypothetical protein KF678_14810, partial [Phycisphaeraceae bacterium]|nr:hypothetical protein [Phycisphaeraceae bacterium]
MTSPTVRVLASAAGFSLAGTALAQWSTDPANNLRIADRTGEQVQPKIQASPDGGCWVSWFDNAAGGYDVYVQRLSADGQEQLPHNGVLVCDRGVSSTVDYDLAVDAEGNALVAYNDDAVVPGSQQISVSKVSPGGTVLWTTTVSSGTLFKANPRLTVLSDGTCVVGYSLGTSPQSWVAQRLSSGGVALWTAPGISIAEAGRYLALCDLKPAGKGFVAMWIRASGTNAITSNKGLALQRFNAAGEAQWNAGAPTIIFAGTSAESVQNGYFPTMAADGAGGVVVGWYEVSGARNAYLQHVLADGSLKFPAPVSNAVTGSNRIRLGAALGFDPSGPAYYLAATEGTLSTVVDRTFVQKFDGTGTRLWGDTGTEIIPIGATQQSFLACLPQADGCIVAGLDTRSSSTKVVFAAKASNDLTVPWSILADSDASTDKGRLGATLSTSGAALLAFQIGGMESWDIAAQRVNPSGTVGPAGCYANCDGSTGSPLLTANDFQCFLNKYAANDTYANCDGSTGNPL